MNSTCSECGAAWTADDSTCQDYFDQMLYWENEYPAYGDVHHLTVLCFHLQHPSRYSQAGLAAAQQLLRDFLLHGLSTEQVRHRRRAQVASDKRDWNITATETSQGAYAHTPRWTMTAADVVAAGREHYQASVRAWAQSIFELLNE